MHQLERLQKALEPTRNELTAHPLYTLVRRPEDFRTFMEYHVYAVWDFMSLLKALQRELTCVEVPWVPKGTADTRYLINEIVLGEESDVDEAGNRISHFELYLRAMEQAGADTREICKFLEAIPSGLRKAIDRQDPGVKAFLDFTFDSIVPGKPHVIAAVFTFGREDLIPGLFLPIVRNFPQEAGWETFRYYLERHIEVDGGHHSHLALRMLEELCGEDEAKWAEARSYALAALKARIALWDRVCECVQQPAGKLTVQSLPA